MRRLRRLRWNVTANRWASSRRRASTYISALVGPMGMGSLPWARKTRSGRLVAAFVFARAAGGASSAGGPDGAGSAMPCGEAAGSPSAGESATATLALSRSFARAMIGKPMPGRTSISMSRAAASATPSWPLPPSTTSRSGNRHGSSLSPVAVASRPRRNRRARTSYMDAKSSPPWACLMLNVR